LKDLCQEAHPIRINMKRKAFLKLCVILFLLQGTSTSDLGRAVRKTMVPFHVHAWVYGYWAFLYEDFMRWEAERRKEKNN
jgi:hypothetical protein